MKRKNFVQPLTLFPKRKFELGRQALSPKGRGKMCGLRKGVAGFLLALFFVFPALSQITVGVLSEDAALFQPYVNQANQTGLQVSLEKFSESFKGTADSKNVPVTR